MAFDTVVSHPLNTALLCCLGFLLPLQTCLNLLGGRLSRPFPRALPSTIFSPAAFSCDLICTKGFNYSDTNNHQIDFSSLKLESFLSSIDPFIQLPPGLFSWMLYRHLKFNLPYKRFHYVCPPLHIFIHAHTAFSFLLAVSLNSFLFPPLLICQASFCFSLPLL